MKKLTTDEFIKRSQALHSDIYDYSKTEYLTAKEKVIIVCKKHGEFLVTPDSHLRRYRGCTKCSMENKQKKRAEKLIKGKFKDLIQPEEYKIIPLTKGYYVKVDNEDFEKLKDIPWCYTNGYAYSGLKGLMHRYIMNTPEDMETDHINHDTLDNRKNNLRICTRSENMANTFSRGGSSKYKGVHWVEREKRWYAQLPKNGKTFLGSFLTEEEAAKAYDKRAKEVYGEFAKLNFETDE